MKYGLVIVCSVTALSLGDDNEASGWLGSSAFSLHLFDFFSLSSFEAACAETRVVMVLSKSLTSCAKDEKSSLH